MQRGAGWIRGAALFSVLVGCGGTEATGVVRSSSPGDAGSGGSTGTGGRGGSSGESAASGGGEASLDASNGRDGAGAATSLPPNQIASTSFGTCALDGVGEIHCWGGDRLGNPGGWVVPSGAFAEIVGSLDNLCAIRPDRTFTCFPHPIGIPDDLSFIPDVKVRAISSARGFVCGIDLSGAPFCAAFRSDYEIAIPTTERLVAISAGAMFACGIREIDGTIGCWGSAGIASDCSYSPQVGQLNAPAGAFSTLATRYDATCAVGKDGAVKCWGAGGPGADPAMTFCDSLVNFGQSVPPPGQFRAVSMSEAHACGVHVDGTIACWGAGQTDAGCDSVDAGYACGQSVPPPGVFEQVALGVRHTCAMTADRKVQCWGWDGDGDGRTAVPAVFQ